MGHHLSKFPCIFTVLKVQSNQKWNLLFTFFMCLYRNWTHTDPQIFTCFSHNRVQNTESLAFIFVDKKAYVWKVILIGRIDSKVQATYYYKPQMSIEFFMRTQHYQVHVWGNLKKVFQFLIIYQRQLHNLQFEFLFIPFLGIFHLFIKNTW